MLRSDFPAADYGPLIQELISPPRLAELGPGRPNTAMCAKLESMTDASLFAGRPLVERKMADACRAGLWLYHDFLDASHRISQEIDSTTGSLWHAIMHRREGDYSNSKYWFRRAGRHAVYEPLGKAARALAAEAIGPRASSSLMSTSEWDPLQFVDRCQSVIGSGSDEESLCRFVQQREWQLLFDYCFQRALGVTV